MQSSRWDEVSSESSGHEVRDELLDVPYYVKDEYQPGSIIHSIKLKDCGSIHARTLYDIEGNVLKGPGGENLHIYSKIMKDELDRGHLKIIHKISDPSYRYMVLNQKQLDTFRAYREHGSVRKLLFWVYPDEDCDRTSYKYLEQFINKKNKHNDTGSQT